MVSTAINNVEINADMMNLIATYGMITPEVIEAAKERQMADILEKHNVTIPEPTWREQKKIWIIAIPKRYSNDGVRHQARGTTPEECKKDFKHRVSRMLLNHEDEESIETKAKKMTVGETVIEFIRCKEGEIKAATHERYVSCYKSHIQGSEFGNSKLQSVRLPDCQQFINSLYHKNLGHGSMKQIKSVVSQAFEYAIAKGYTTINYMRTVKINVNKCSTGKAHKKEAWSNEEIQKLWNGSLQLWKSHRYYYSAVYLALISTGCRVGELLAAEWSDIDFDKREFFINKTVIRYTDYETGKKILTVNSSKTAESQRTIQLTDDAIFWLKEIKKRNTELGRNSGRVIETREGGLATSNIIDDSAKRFCQELGIEYKSSHSCRRTYASVMREHGISIMEIASDLGHRDISTTENNYCKDRNSKETALEQKNAALRATRGNNIKTPETYDFREVSGVSGRI